MSLTEAVQQQISFSQRVWNRMVETCDNEEHSSRGWSKIGYCMGTQTLAKLHPEIPFDGYGMTQGGTLLHEWMQMKVFPAGMIWNGYEIIAHEVPVFMVINGEMRMSKIDTLVWHIEGQYFEVWDYKIDAYVTGRRKDGPKPQHKMQINQYSYLQGAKGYRVFYVSKFNYADLWITDLIPTDPDLAQTGINRLTSIDVYAKDQKVFLWSQMAESITTFEEKHSDCEYCSFNETSSLYGKRPCYCLELFKLEFGRNFTGLAEVKQFIINQKRGIQNVN